MTAYNLLYLNVSSSNNKQKNLCSKVTFADPARFDLRGTVKVGHDVRIDVNVIIEGDCELGDFVEIGAGCILKIQPLQQVLKSKRTAFLMEQLLGKIPKLVHSHAYVQVLNWQTK